MRTHTFFTVMLFLAVSIANATNMNHDIPGTTQRPVTPDTVCATPTIITTLPVDSLHPLVVVSTCEDILPLQRGFCVDDDERLYFLTATPQPWLICYESSKPVWRRAIPTTLRYSFHAVCRIHEDSVRILDEQRGVTLSVSKDGTGSIKEAKVPIPSCDSIIYACPTIGGYKIITVNPKKQTKPVWDVWDNFIGDINFYDITWDGHATNIYHCNEICAMTIHKLRDNIATDTPHPTNWDLGYKTITLNITDGESTTPHKINLKESQEYTLTGEYEVFWECITSGNLVCFKGNSFYVPIYDHVDKLLQVFKYDISHTGNGN